MNNMPGRSNIFATFSACPCLFRSLSIGKTREHGLQLRNHTPIKDILYYKLFIFQKYLGIVKVAVAKMFVLLTICFFENGQGRNPKPKLTQTRPVSSIRAFWFLSWSWTGREGDGQADKGGHHDPLTPEVKL